VPTRDLQYRTPDSISICVTVSVLDDLGNTYSGALPTAILFSVQHLMSFCQFNVEEATNCTEGGCVEIQVCGGVTPYQVLIDGQFANLDQQQMIFPSCGYGPGTYTLSITDANGCLIEDSFTIQEYSGVSTNAIVYFDANNDADLNEGFLSEPTLSNQGIHFVEPDITVYTDANGKCSHWRGSRPVLTQLNGSITPKYLISLLRLIPL
jgi:hypothetical protein